MVTLTGKGAFGGISMGRLRFFRREQQEIEYKYIENTEAEYQRLNVAIASATAELLELAEQASKSAGANEAEIFQIHAMMLEDGELSEAIINTLREKHSSAEYAVQETAKLLRSSFEAMDSAYMQARGTDITDISSRLISTLTGNEKSKISFSHGEILCADDLTPSETVGLDKDKLAAFVTAYGSVSSHTAILSRSMEIPAVLGVGTSLFDFKDGTEAIVDGAEGKVYIDPDKKTKAEMTARQEQLRKQNDSLQLCRGLESITADGRKINLYANIQSPSQLSAALNNDAEGIGLFRSEFLFLERSSPPSEEEQFNAYKAVLEGMGKRKVIIRTLDIGADKQVEYLGLKKEENPALGLRGIRLCLSRPDIFLPQLRALLRASAYGSLAIMFPMISSIEELAATLTLIDKVRSELGADGVPFSPSVELGIMVETPAAAIICDLLAPMVDFFSIGTNDLTQYTLAQDRQNASLEPFFNPRHQSVIRLISHITDIAHKSGKWVGICGELAADTTLTEIFLQLGIDELSVSPSYILPLRNKIRNINLKNS